MTWVLGVIAASLGIFFLWGLTAPRSQWRVISAWSVSNAYANEPGGASYGWRRLVSGVGVLGIGLVAVLGAAPGLLAALPQEQRTIPPIEKMWGAPDPQMVDRSIGGSTTVPEGLVEVPVLGYQNLDELDELPSYILDLTPFTLLGDASPRGYIGSAPAEGFSGVGPADLIVNVRGSVLCIPREAVVIETDTAVQIAIYYGLPDPKLGDDPTVVPPEPDHVAGCPLDDAVAGSVLIPITLKNYLGDRTVETLDGTKIRKVELAE
ncbi:MAG: fumarate hydratase [Actinobacteria bacterium]|nr:fumarate hydratase [Actinomycetota bacterium]